MLEYHKNIVKKEIYLSRKVKELSKEYQKIGFSSHDAIILAFAAIASVDFFITENRRSITRRGNTLKKLRKINSEKGLETPEILTPLDFLKRHVFYT